MSAPFPSVRPRSETGSDLIVSIRMLFVCSVCITRCVSQLTYRGHRATLTSITPPGCLLRVRSTTQDVLNRWSSHILFAYPTSGTPCSIKIEALGYEPECRGFETRWAQWYFLQIYLILPAALGTGVYSASNRTEYQKHKNNNVSGELSVDGV
jgi:hypothetical protein